METRSIVVFAAWICVTMLSALIIWVTRQLNLWNAIFILLLVGIAFVITLTIPFGLPTVEQAPKPMQ